MNKPIEIAKATLLEPMGITENNLFDLFSKMMSRNIDLGDIYFQLSQQESWILEDGIIKEGSFNIDQGVGIRAISGEKTGFAYSDEISLESLNEATRVAANIAKSGQGGQVKILQYINRRA